MRLSLFILLMLSAVSAGEYNKVLKIGDEAPVWKDLPGTDDKKHSLTDFQAKEVLVVLFTCNTCPVANDYEPRVQAFVEKHCKPESKVGFVAINVNAVKGDSLEEMKKRAEKKKYGYSYLFDESQEIARKFGATTTPEFFVLDAKRKVVYMGAMDDVAPPKAPNSHYLETAVTQLLNKAPIEKSETLPRGCKIRWKK
ncbi:MAG: thioredoxin family protein [Fimbriiglobus sp.]